MPKGPIEAVSDRGFVLTRTAFPDLVPAGMTVSPDDFGSEFSWGWGVPGCFQALAAPRSGAAVPARPRKGDPHAQSLGYWGALHYLLLYRLGWSAPHRGLQRWYELGKPTDDPTLRFVEHVWGRDSGLDVYLHWLLRRRPIFTLTGGQPWAEQDANDISEEWKQWLRSFADSREASAFEWFNNSGGSDPLHLTGHFEQLAALDSDATLLVDPEEHERAHLIARSMGSFYRQLYSRSATLPISGLRSWKVDVHVSNVGNVGTYRRSAVTGLWFTGRHRIHELGN